MSGFFFLNDPATPEIYTLSLHDALPILQGGTAAPVLLTRANAEQVDAAQALAGDGTPTPTTGGHLVSWRHSPRRPSNVAVVTADRKSTRLNSSHANISYAVFCLKKKNKP